MPDLPQLKPLRKPTFKEQKLVKVFVKSGSKYQAMSEAYPNTKRKWMKINFDTVMRRPQVQDYMRQIMEESGLTDKFIAGKLKAIANAGTSVEALQTATPAHAIAVLKEMNKMKDNYPAEKKQIDTRIAKMSIDLKGKSPEELEATLSQLLEETRSFKKLVETKYPKP